MIRYPTGLALAAATLIAAVAPSGASAAGSYDSCTGFIAALPAVITTQGTWCLDKDLSTAASSGAAITVGVNNVTIDCNGFKLGNLAAGAATMTYGVLADGRLNTTVRGCTFRGFRGAVFFHAQTAFGGGHLVEDNRIEGATAWGVGGFADNVIVRRNHLVDIGGAAVDNSSAEAVILYGRSHVIDNVVSGVESTGTGEATGILIGNGDGSTVRGNAVSGVGGGGGEYGININAGRVSVHDNDVIGRDQPGSYGIHCTSEYVGVRANSIGGFDENIHAGCGAVSGNLTF